MSLEKQGQLGYGDVGMWTAIDAETQLVPCWHIRRSTARGAADFIHDLAPRLANRVQPTTDGLRLYLVTIAQAFHFNIDYAQLVKL